MNLERLTMIDGKSTEEDIKTSAQRIIQEGLYNNTDNVLALKSRSKYKNLSVDFLQDFARYYDTVSLNLEFKVPGSLREFIKQMAIRFNDPVYDLGAKERNMKGLINVESQVKSSGVPDQDGFISFGVTQAIFLRNVVPQNLLFVKSVELHLTM
jgi:hypothetical protein